MSRLFRQLTTAFALFAVPATAWAQDGATVSGRVISETGAPIGFASVLLEGMGLGAQTRQDGTYSISVPSARARGQQATITARAIGYRASSAQVALSQGNVAQNFTLAANPLRLGEVVVTGAGTTNTTEKLGAVISSVKAEEITKSNEVNAVQSLAAKAPGVVVTSSSGEPGAASFIQIRGAKSIDGGSQPLFVVDGVSVDNSATVTTFATAGTVSPNRMADLNPADIESVEILKGAAAAAIYGARAGAGVVLITTKRGRAGQTRMTFRSSYSQDEVNRDYPLQTKFSQGTGGRAAQCTRENCALTGASFGARLAAGTPVYNHFLEMFRTGSVIDNSLNVSGGNERTTFYLSGGRTDHKGVIVGPNNFYNRTTVLLKGTHDLNEKVRVGANFNYVDVKGSFIQKGSNLSGLLLGALRSPPEFDNKVYKDSATGLHRAYRFPRPGPTSLNRSRTYDNPFFIVNEMENTSEVGRAFGSFNADYTPFGWLNVKYTLGADYSSDARIEGLPPSNSSEPTGQIDRANYTTYQLDHNLLATASKDFNQNLNASLTVGQNLNSRRYTQLQVRGKGFIAPDLFTLANTISTNLLPLDYESLVHLESYFSEGKLDLYNQLFLTAGVRNDASSTFGKSVRRNWFPKASAAWAFSEAMGVRDGSGLFSYGKLRAAYGQTGREPFAYQIFSGYTTAQFGDGWTTGLNPSQAGNAGLSLSAAKGQDKLKPERNTETEYGVDLAFLDSKVDLGLTFYDAKSTDVILGLPLPPSTGYFSQVQNAAEITNKGIEVALNVRPVTTNSFAWTIGAQWARNKNKVVDLRGAEQFYIPGGFVSGIKAGFAHGIILDYDFARCRYSEGDDNVVDGFDVNAFCKAQSAPNGAMYIGDDGFPIFDSKQRVVGDPNPDWTGNLSTSITLFKKLQVSALLDVRKGGDIWNGTKGALFNFGAHRDTEIRGESRTFGKDFLPGTVIGPGKDKAVVIDQGSWFTNLGSGFVGPASQFVEDGSFTKLREVSVAYTFDGGWLRNSGFSTLDLRLSGRNLGLWTDYTGIDPESNLGGATSARGNEYFNNPQTRSFVISVGLNR